MGINGPSLRSVDGVEWAYTVTFTNQTTDVLDKVVVLHKRKTAAGVVFKEHNTIAPGETRVFNLDLCGDMESYVMGIYIGDNLIFQIPETGNMTRELASQLNPTDQYLCEDSWRLNEG